MLETCVGVFSDRHFPATMMADHCRALQDSGVVDGVLLPDQLAGFIPRQLWTPENSPLAAIMDDPDSPMDAFMSAAYVHAAAPELNLHVSTDAVRRGPAELLQAMLTLAHLTEGRATVQVGGGEIKQTGPFGHPTNQGVSRSRDLFALYRQVLDCEGPFDFVGRRWTWDHAYLGGAREHKPEMWGLGGGPELLDYTTSYADGLGIIVPCALATPEITATTVAAIRRKVEEKGRDPKAFRIGLWFMVLLHDDPATLDTVMDNPIIRFNTAAVGRIDTDLWRQEGRPLPWPDGWTYFKNLLPWRTDDALLHRILAATTREHVEAAWSIGSPTQVCAAMEPYLEAGVDWVMPIDYLPIIGDPADASASVSRMIELCAALKAL